MATDDRAISLEDGPWLSMIDSIAPTSRKEGALIRAQNVYPLDPAIGDGLVGRPGCAAMGAQLGTAGRRRVQGGYQYTKRDGTQHTICIVGGYFYQYDWITSAWTEVVTNANLATATITLSQTAKVAFVTMSDKLVVSDGVNLLWSWDGTAGAGGLTKLVNCPVLYGQPTIQDGRLVGPKAADRSVFVWSEADDMTIGYDTGGYTNAWRITQTDPGTLTRLVGSNAALYILRARSATLATGDMAVNFQSEATKEGISSTTGTASPFAIVEVESGFIMLDADLHPQLYRQGAVGFTEIWTAFRETLRRIPKTAVMAAKCMGVYYSPASLALIAVPDTVSATECQMLLVYDCKGSTPIPVGIWNGWEMTMLAMVKSGAAATLDNPYLIHGDTLGYVYLHGNPEDAAPWDDFLSTGTVPIAHVVECQGLGYSTKREKIFDRIDVALRAQSAMTLNISATTARGDSSAQTVFVPYVTPPDVTQWDVSEYDAGRWDSDPPPSGEELHVDVGIDLESRWIKPKVSHATLGEQFGIVALTVLAYPTDDDPEAP